MEFVGKVYMLGFKQTLQIIALEKGLLLTIPPTSMAPAPKLINW